MKICNVNNSLRFNSAKNDSNALNNISDNKFTTKKKVVWGTVGGVAGLGTLGVIFRKKLPPSVKNFFEKLCKILDDCI